MVRILRLVMRHLLQYIAKDVLGHLVRLSEADRPFGIQAEVLRAVANMVVLLDEQFLVHSAVHKAVLRLLRGCVGDQIEEQVDGRAKPMGAASNAVRSTPSEYEEDRKCQAFKIYTSLLTWISCGPSLHFMQSNTKLPRIAHDFLP